MSIRNGLSRRSVRALAGASAASALVASSFFLSSSPAHAMISENFAEPGPVTDSIVSLTLGSAGADSGDCTGTAISSRWVVTARHCVDGESEQTGSIRIGQGDKTRTVAVDGWEVAPKGDVAMIHAAEDLGLDFYPKVGSKIDMSQEATIYGWSPDGSGKGKKLPYAKASFEEGESLSLYEGSKSVTARLKDGARLQPGDSGGPVFTNDEVIGVLSAAIDMSNPEATTSPTGVFASLEENTNWISETMSKDSVDKSAATAEKSVWSSPILWACFGGVVVVALFVAMALRKKKGE